MKIKNKNSKGKKWNILRYPFNARDSSVNENTSDWTVGGIKHGNKDTDK